jgi:hypothetical protein
MYEANGMAKATNIKSRCMYTTNTKLYAYFFIYNG